MTNEIVKQETGWMTPADLRGQVNLIQQVMAQVMKIDEHYGTIPGCKKASLWKPGAEKLALTFHLRPIIGCEDIIITDLPNGHREVRVFCHIVSTSREELATGIGSCSTMEAKYRYRGGEKKGTGQAVPHQYWNLKKDGKFAEAAKLIGGPGFAAGKVDGNWQVCEIGEKMDNPDLADCYNTVLKMAKKRAFVDGMLSSTAASDIFTQDLEDAEGNDEKEKPTEAAKEPTPEPKRKSEKAAAKAPEPKPADPAPAAPAIKHTILKVAECARSRDEDDKLVFVFTSADSGKKVYSYDEKVYTFVKDNITKTLTVGLDLSGPMPIIKEFALAPVKKDA